MLNTIILPAFLLLLIFFFLAACIGEKAFQNKVLYATVAVILLFFLLARA